jgi:hypothetical protein
MMRRRALLAASMPSGEVDENLPPESTEFVFPLYLNTKIIEKSDDYLYRERQADELVIQLVDYYIKDLDVGKDVENLPVYIDGYQIKSAYINPDFYEISDIVTDKDYGNYTNVAIVISEMDGVLVDAWN